jgi:hypothetical protein
MEELIVRRGELALVRENMPTLAVYPASGFAILPLRINESSRSFKAKDVFELHLLSVILVPGDRDHSSAQNLPS